MYQFLTRLEQLEERMHSITYRAGEDGDAHERASSIYRASKPDKTIKKRSPLSRALGSVLHQGDDYVFGDITRNAVAAASGYLNIVTEKMAQVHLLASLPHKESLTDKEVESLANLINSHDLQTIATLKNYNSEHLFVSLQNPEVRKIVFPLLYAKFHERAVLECESLLDSVFLRDTDIENHTVDYMKSLINCINPSFYALDEMFAIIVTEDYYKNKNNRRLLTEGLLTCDFFGKQCHDPENFDTSCFKKLARKYHPDKPGGNTELFQIFQECDPRKKIQQDEISGGERSR